MASKTGPCCLARTNMTNANLREAALFNANLQGTNLTGANLFQADLRGATGVNLFGTLGAPRFMPDDPLDE